jgi:hypothetical protein
VGAIGRLAGAAIVLDGDLRVVAATPEAERVAGVALPAGVSALKLLCGEAVERPMAEALAEGRAVKASIPRPIAGGGELMLLVRTVPLGDDPRRSGWLLLLDEEYADPQAADAPIQFLCARLRTGSGAVAYEVDHGAQEANNARADNR